MNFLDRQLFRIGETPVTVSSLVVALAILVASYIAARFFRRVVSERLLGRTHMAVGVRYALGRIVGYLILLLGALVALQTLGVNATMLAAFGAALGVGIGFGLQDIVKNFVAGLILLIERQIEVGDRIQVGDVVGDVQAIRARATIVRTNDEVDLIVPNSKLITETVFNWSYGSRRIRFRIPVGVAYGSDVRTVRDALLEAAAGSANVLKEPAPAVRLTGFGESSLDFELLCWTSAMLHRQGTFESEMNFLIYEALTARGIEIPFPQRDLHVRSAPALERVLRRTGQTSADETSASSAGGPTDAER